MQAQLQEKLKQLPAEPGVYFHKDAANEIIYVGKAAVLKNRVRHYFQKSRNRDPKTAALIAEIADTDWMVVDSEMEALFLEAEMIRRYMPRYNILLRDDKAMGYIRIDYDAAHPTVSTTRRPLDDGARYFGPYVSMSSVRQALKLLRRIFPYSTHKALGQKRTTLHYHIGLDPGLEEQRTSLAAYRANLRKLMAVLQGKQTQVMRELERDMHRAAKTKNFELAAKLRNQLYSLKNLRKQILFSDKDFLDISKDHALRDLVSLLGLAAIPQRIEGYDISHQQGTDVVASMVVFTNGVSNRGDYRKFKTKIDQNNDFYNMHETITRRLSPKNIQAWGTPDLVLIDGGKGQLDAAVRARDSAGYALIPFIGLAKREEQIVIQKRQADTESHVELRQNVVRKLGGYVTESDTFLLVTLPHSTHIIKLLQRIRDESHRFAVSYHSTLKAHRQTRSSLDTIPSIGAVTRKTLLRSFGSMRGVQQASYADLAAVVGSHKAQRVVEYFTKHTTAQ